MNGNVLALSGGGYRGLYTVRVLRHLEERIGKSLTEHFDLIAGTSIGGIIALGLAAGISLETIERKFIEKGSDIFPKPVRPHKRGLFAFRRTLFIYRMVRAVFFPIHKPDGLRDLLDDLFGDMRMKDLDKAYVIVTSSNLSTGAPKVFKTPHHEEIYLDANLKVVDVALATSAAPAYFPFHGVDLTPISPDKIEELDGSEPLINKESLTNSYFADGALMGNAPGLFGWLEARTRLGFRAEDISVLSVGTLAGKPSVSGGTKPNQGALFWLNPIKLRLLTFLMSQQEQTTHYMLRLLLGKNYCLIDEAISDEASSDIDLDDTSHKATRTLAAQADKHFAEFTNTEFCKTHFPRSEVN